VGDFLSVKAAEWVFLKTASHEVSVVFCCQQKNMLLKCFYDQLCDLKPWCLIILFLFFEMALFFITSKKFANHRGSV